MREIKSISINLSDSILSALKKMDEVGVKLLIVMKDERFESLLSIGDIQRAIIANVDLNKPIKEIIRKDITVAKEGDNLELVKERMHKRRNEFMPVLSPDKQIKKILFWEDLFDLKKRSGNLPENMPVVIMAGGKGSRLRPLTNVLPKPLIPLKEKTILEEIMDNFVEAGCNDFFISVNYKAEMIKHYFQTLNNPNYQITYFQENNPLGTAGSMFLLKGQINSTFFVSNCDILIEEDLEEIYNYHKRNNNSITIIAALKNYPISYGIMETGEEGMLKKIIEKPELTFKINSGMYILEPDLLNIIPSDTFFHITDLINKVQKQHGRVGVFPVSEGSWTDIGTWTDFLKWMPQK